jgi:hypothetical protein
VQLSKHFNLRLLASLQTNGLTHFTHDHRSQEHKTHKVPEDDEDDDDYHEEDEDSEAYYEDPPPDFDVQETKL